MNGNPGRHKELQVEAWTGTLNKAFLKPTSVNASQHGEYLDAAKPQQSGQSAGPPPVYISNSRDKTDQRQLDEDERLKFDAERVKALDNPPTSTPSKVPSWAFHNGNTFDKAAAAPVHGGAYGPASNLPIQPGAPGGNPFGSTATAPPPGPTAANGAAPNPAAGGAGAPAATGAADPAATAAPAAAPDAAAGGAPPAQV